MVHTGTLQVSTGARRELVDITSRVAEVVEASGVGDGIVLVFTRHTTTGLCLNERESGLLKDVEDSLGRMVPEGKGYLHDRVDNNASSHIQSIVLGPSLTLPVLGGSLDLGTWQSILLAERDGPRRRTITVRVVGEA
jgi:secondary thiamine-phosphate synthase enzyme